jgi:hypothetical protein
VLVVVREVPLTPRLPYRLHVLCDRGGRAFEALGHLAVSAAVQQHPGDFGAALRDPGRLRVRDRATGSAFWAVQGHAFRLRTRDGSRCDTAQLDLHRVRLSPRSLFAARALHAGEGGGLPGGVYFDEFAASDFAGLNIDSMDERRFVTDYPRGVASCALCSRMATPSKVVTYWASCGLFNSVPPGGDDSRFLKARVNDDGSLVISGQDLGPATAMISNDGEYECAHTCPAESVPLLCKALGGNERDDILDLLERRYTK